MRRRADLSWQRCVVAKYRAKSGEARRQSDRARSRPILDGIEQEFVVARLAVLWVSPCVAPRSPIPERCAGVSDVPKVRQHILGRICWQEQITSNSCSPGFVERLVGRMLQNHVGAISE